MENAILHLRSRPPRLLLHFNHIWQRALISLVVDYHKLLLLLILLTRLQIDGPIGGNLHHDLVAVGRLPRVLLRTDVSDDVLLVGGRSSGDPLVGNRRSVLQAVGLKQSVIVEDLSNEVLVIMGYTCSQYSLPVGKVNTGRACLAPRQPAPHCRRHRHLFASSALSYSSEGFCRCLLRRAQPNAS